MAVRRASAAAISACRAAPRARRAARVPRAPTAAVASAASLPTVCSASPLGSRSPSRRTAALMMRDVARPRPDQRIAHGELRPEVPLRVARADGRAIGAELAAPRTACARRACPSSRARSASRTSPRTPDRRRSPCGRATPGAARPTRSPSLPRGGSRAGARAPSTAVNRSRDVTMRCSTIAVLGDRAQLALALVEINSYALHGWPPGWLLRHRPRVQPVGRNTATTLPWRSSRFIPTELQRLGRSTSSCSLEGRALLLSQS